MSYNRNSDEALGKNLTVNSDAQRHVEPVVMCTTQDAFEFFGAALVDCYEHYFAGGENEIAQISYNFQKAFEGRLDKDGKYT